VLAVAALLAVSPGCKSQTTRDQPTAGIGMTSAADTGSSIGSGFNSTPIPAGSTIWFTAVMKVQGLGAQPVHLSLNASTVTFTASSQTYTVGVPNAAITIDPAATQATTAYDTTLGQWETVLPVQWSGNALLSAVAFPVTTDLPGGISPVTWNGTIDSDTSGLTVSWSWGCVDGDGLRIRLRDAFRRGSRVVRRASRARRGLGMGTACGNGGSVSEIGRLHQTST
jgi:hypothetical protein